MALPSDERGAAVKPDPHHRKRLPGPATIMFEREFAADPDGPVDADRTVRVSFANETVRVPGALQEALVEACDPTPATIYSCLKCGVRVDVASADEGCPLCHFDTVVDADTHARLTEE